MVVEGFRNTITWHMRIEDDVFEPTVISDCVGIPLPRARDGMDLGVNTIGSTHSRGQETQTCFTSNSGDNPKVVLMR